MPATIDDLLVSSQRIEAALDRLVRNQSRQTSLYRNRYLNRYNTSPRQHAWRGMHKLLAGKWKDAKKQFGRAWTKYKRQKGFNRFGRVGGNILGVASVLDHFRKAIIAATDSLVAANRKYAEMSASMAVVMAQRDVRELTRDIRKGDQLAVSARTLTDAEQFRKDNTQGIEVLAGHLQNFFVGGLNVLLGGLLAPINKLAEAINELIDNLPGQGERPATASEWAASVERDRRQQLIDAQRLMEQVARDIEAAKGWRR